MPNLDLLRSIAVLFVIGSHAMIAMGCESLSPFGWSLDLGYVGTLGVVIFFVHTCLVLMWSLERNADPMGFYVRRIFRIYPLSIFVVLIIVGFHIPVSISGNAVRFTHLVSKWQLPANLLLVQNIVRVPNVMGPLWTLPLEVQMYLLLPFLFYFVRQNRVLWPLMTLWLAVVALNHYQDYGVNYLVTVVPFFLPGVMAYVGFGRIRPRIPGWVLPIVLAAIVFLSVHRPTVHAMYFYALALGLLLPFFKQIQSRWLKRASLTIAKYSYGAYLSHPFAILIGMTILAAHSHLTQMAVTIVFIVVTVVPAYHFIEEPMIRAGSRLAKRIARKHHVPVAA